MLEDGPLPHVPPFAHQRGRVRLFQGGLQMPDLAAKLRFLQSASSYGDTGSALTCIETHMSWVFLLDKLVFKLKKPVRFPFLDFTTLESREFYCHEEVRLNARLAPGVYLGVVALLWHEGAFSLVPQGRLPACGTVQDWLVVMRRLPLPHMLDQRIARQQVGAPDLEALIGVLGHFYREAPTAPVSAHDYLARFSRELALDRAVLLRPEFQLREAAKAIDGLGQALVLCASALRERVLCDWVRDGHGDLRPEHVCLLQPPVVIDCLEFNPQLRQLDPFDEIAYLALECRMAGASWMGPVLVSGLARALGDAPPAALLSLYTARRALLRARLAMAHLLDPQPRRPEKWRPLALRYLAHSFAASQAVISGAAHGRPE